MGPSLIPPARSLASPGLLELDDFSIRPLQPGDFATLKALQPSIPAQLFELPEREAEFGSFLVDLGGKAWSLPFVCFRGREPVGFCFMNVAQLKNLNAYLVALFSRPADAVLPLALYIRHAFWSYPLHRLYSQLPSLPELLPHREALMAVGFKNEGSLVAHIATADGPFDAVVVGLLRDEFNQWCMQNEPRLVLA